MTGVLSPCFARLDVVNDLGADKLKYPLSAPAVPLVESDEEREAREMDEAGNAGGEQEAGPNARLPWQCPACGEENPGNFYECWKCQAMQRGSKIG